LAKQGTTINTRFHNEPDFRLVFLVRRPFQNLGNQQTGRGYRPLRGGSTIINNIMRAFHIDRNVLGITLDATELMQKNCLKFGYK
jgi:hypothetical protein